MGAAESWHPAGPEGGRGAADSTWILPAAYLLARPRSAQDGRRMPAGWKVGNTRVRDDAGENDATGM